MDRQNVVTKILAITGTALVWLPIITPILLAIVMFAVRGEFLFDYLMPMELFLFTVIGGALLLWATLRAHSRVRLVAWSIGSAILLFFGTQWFAVSTGLASGETEPGGWAWVVILALLGVYGLAVVLIGTGGALLLSDLFRKRLPAIHR